MSVVDRDVTLTRVRAVALTLVAAMLAMAVGVAFVAREIPPRADGDVAGVLVPLTALFGLVSPVLGYRLYLLIRERPAPAAVERFRTATILGLAVTESAAFSGLIAYLLSGRVETLIGLVTHILLAGAIWPSDERLRMFEER